MLENWVLCWPGCQSGRAIWPDALAIRVTPRKNIYNTFNGKKSMVGPSPFASGNAAAVFAEYSWIQRGSAQHTKYKLRAEILISGECSKLVKII